MIGARALAHRPAHTAPWTRRRARARVSCPFRVHPPARASDARVRDCPNCPRPHAPSAASRRLQPLLASGSLFAPATKNVATQATPPSLHRRALPLALLGSVAGLAGDPPTAGDLTLLPLLPPRRAGRRDDHGRDRGSEGPAAGRGVAPPEAVGAVTPGRFRRRRARSAPLVVVAPARRRRRLGEGALWRPAGGSPGQAHGPPPRRSRPPPSASAAEARASITRAPGSAASTAHAAAAGGPRCQAMEPAGPEAPAIGTCGGSCCLVVRRPGAGGGEGAVRRPGAVRGGADGGGGRGGHLRPDRRPAAAASTEAAARRAAAARYAAPGAMADRDHRRRLQGPRRVSSNHLLRPAGSPHRSLPVP